MSRGIRQIYQTSQPSLSSLSTAQWVEGDLTSGEGLEQAVRDIDVIVHCIGGTSRLLEAARMAKVSHIVFISIVGCDRVPLSYYHQKVAEEEMIKRSGIPFSILRAAQFHALIDFILRSCSHLPGISFLPTSWRFQPIAESEVGRYMADLALAAPTETTQEIGGPQVLSIGEMALTWIKLRQLQRKVLPLWIPGKVARGFRQGGTTCGFDNPPGQITWAEWVQQVYHRTAAAPALA